MILDFLQRKAKIAENDRKFKKTIKREEEKYSLMFDIPRVKAELKAKELEDKYKDNTEDIPTICDQVFKSNCE